MQRSWAGRPNKLPGRFKRRANRAGATEFVAPEVRIITPTVYRDSYLSALRAATHGGPYAALYAALDFARRWTAQVDFSSRQAAEADIARTNAMREPTEAENAGVRLALP